MHKYFLKHIAKMDFGNGKMSKNVQETIDLNNHLIITTDILMR